MKRFACGDVVPGCTAVFTGDTDTDILQAVGHHAQHDHGMSSVPDSLVEQVRSHIVTV